MPVSGPSTINSHSGQRYGSTFPRFEVAWLTGDCCHDPILMLDLGTSPLATQVQDQVAAQFVLLDHLGIEKVHACVRNLVFWTTWTVDSGCWGLRSQLGSDPA